MNGNGTDGVLVVHFGIGKNAGLIIDCIKAWYQEDGVTAIKLESLVNHGFYGWLLRSSVPGLKTPVKEVDLDGSRFIFLMAPKWSYNCPPIGGFINSHDFHGRQVALIVTYTKGNVDGYVDRLTRMLRKQGADLVGSIPIKRDEAASGALQKKMNGFLTKVASNASSK